MATLMRVSRMVNLCPLFRTLSPRSFLGVSCVSTRRRNVHARRNNVGKTTLFVRSLYNIPGKRQALESTSPEDVDDGRKVMVVRLRLEDDEEATSKLRNYFSMYGEVEKVFRVHDKTTGRPKSFCFISFVDKDSAEMALSQTGHIIDGKAVRVLRPLKPGEKPAGLPNKGDVYLEDQAKTVFFRFKSRELIRKYSQNDDSERFKEYFLRFGKVEDVCLSPSNNHGFLIFKDKESAAKALEMRRHRVDGWTVLVDRTMSVKDKNVLSKKKRTVYVCNVPNEATTKELEEHFSKFGEVEEVYFQWSDCGKEINLCKVLFCTIAGAIEALKEPCHELTGCGSIQVRCIGDFASSKQIIVYNPPWNVTVEDLRFHFEQFGNIKFVHLAGLYWLVNHTVMDGVLSRGKIGSPILEFTDETSVERVMENSPHILCNSTVRVGKVQKPVNGVGTINMTVLIDHLPCSGDKDTLVKHFIDQSVAVKFVMFFKPAEGEHSAIVGFWNLDDVDRIIDQVATQENYSIGGRPVLVRRLSWSSSQEEASEDEEDINFSRNHEEDDNSLGKFL